MGKKEILRWWPGAAEEKDANPVRHGLIKVKKDGETAGHFFEYSDGQPVLWIGDTWWNWTDRRIHHGKLQKTCRRPFSKGI